MMTLERDLCSKIILAGIILIGIYQALDTNVRYHIFQISNINFGWDQYFPTFYLIPNQTVPKIYFLIDLFSPHPHTACEIHTQWENWAEGTPGHSDNSLGN